MSFSRWSNKDLRFSTNWFLKYSKYSICNTFMWHICHSCQRIYVDENVVDKSVKSLYTFPKHTYAYTYISSRISPIIYPCFCFNVSKCSSISSLIYKIYYIPILYYYIVLYCRREMELSHILDTQINKYFILPPKIMLSLALCQHICTILFQILNIMLWIVLCALCRKIR